MRRLSLFLVVLTLSSFVTPAQAAVKVNGLFTDNTVLQQGTKVPVWGTAEGPEKITVKFAGQEVSAQVSDALEWVVYLEPLKAGGPFEMTISGSSKITLKNVMIGEVWICSGQSNMEWRVGNCKAEDIKDAKAAPKNPHLRMFTVGQNTQEKPVNNVSGAWIEASPESVLSFSAAGYFFGKEIQERLKVPVGLINTSWGGTRAEAWTSRPALRKLGDDYKQMVEGHEAAFAKDAKVAKNPNAPSTLYNGMVAPIVPYAVAGVIWYQGESNAGQAHNYGRLFPAMIENWRDEWKVPKMPFYFVQLAPFTQVRKQPGASDWAELRESQRQTALNLPNTGMAVITDLGHEADIHPTPKKPVGQRLAWIALEDAYHQKMESMKAPDITGKPMFADGKAILTVNAEKLVARELVPTDERKDGKGISHGFAWRVKEDSKEGAEVTGFTIAGEDGKFHNAQAKIDKNKITVWSDQVAEPAAVRYGWDNHPICNVFSAAGIPMTPFRTDDLPFITAPKGKSK